MALPGNTTCDIYRTGTSPPAAPAETALPCSLAANYQMGLEHGEGDSTAKKYTHKMMVDWCADIRDAWDNETVGGTADTVYIPDKNGTGFKVVFVEMFSQGAPNARKMVYLARKSVTWPSTEV